MRRVMLIVQVAFLLCFFTADAFADRVGHENRKSIEDYAASHKMAVADARVMFGATGRIMCPFNEGTAFLVDKSDIVVTARHILFPELSQNSYAGHVQIRRCAFEVTIDGKTSKWHKVDVSSFVYPNKKQRSTTDRFDWVVMKLAEPVTEVAPYRLSPTRPRKGEAVTVASIRQQNFKPDDWNARIIENCKVKAVRNIDGVAASGLSTDCSADPGASGAAVLHKGPKGQEVVGLVSSSTVKHCEKYNPRSCFTFAVGLSGDVVRAIHNIAGD